MSKSKKLVDDFASTNKINSSQTLTIPCDIIMEEILPRLPVKSLICFKSVSKHWNSIISSYCFAKLRLKFSNSFDKYFVINAKASYFCERDPLLHLLPQKEYTCMNELIGINPFKDQSPHLTLVDCCDDPFSVWNPVTRECRDVVNPGGDVYYTRAWGFGYVSSLNGYLIVSSFGMKENSNRWSGFYVFSLREGNWKVIDVDENVGRDVLFNSIWIDGNVYWSRLFERAYYIISLNSVEEELKKYPLTFWESNVYCRMDLYSLKGVWQFVVSDFWVLKNQDDWSSWEKLFTVNLGSISFIDLFDQGKCLLRRCDQFRVVDLCKKALEDVHGDFVGEGLDIDYYGSVLYSESCFTI